MEFNGKGIAKTHKGYSLQGVAAFKKKLILHRYYFLNVFK
jgi:hypothetical protein